MFLLEIIDFFVALLGVNQRKRQNHAAGWPAAYWSYSRYEWATHFRQRYNGDATVKGHADGTRLYVKLSPSQQR